MPHLHQIELSIRLKRYREAFAAPDEVFQDLPGYEATAG